MEIFKPIPGYEGLYEVSSCGRIVACEKVDRTLKLRKRRVLTPVLNAKAGHYGVSLIDRKGVRKKLYVHQIVAGVFLEPSDTLRFLRHLDGDNSNNCVCNLEWATSADIYRASGGQTIPADSTVDEVRNMYAEGISGVSIAGLVGVPESTVYSWIRGDYRNGRE